MNTSLPVALKSDGVDLGFKHKRDYAFECFA